MTAATEDTGANTFRTFGPKIAAMLDEELEGGSWLREIRRRAFERAETVPFPTDRDELWRYTTPDLFDFSALADAETARFLLTDSSGGAITPIQGVSLLQAGSLTAKNKEAVLWVLSQQEDLAVSPISDLQTAIVQNVAVLRIERNTLVKAPLYLSQAFQKGQTAVASHLVIVVEEGARATVVEDLSFQNDTFLLPRIDFVLEQGSSFEFVSLQRLSKRATYLGRHRIHAGRDANAQFVHVALGCKVSRLDLDCRLIEQGASVDLYAVTLATGDRHFDLHPTQDHRAPHCRSELYCKNVLKDAARTVYYGYIRVAEGAQKTDAYQTNRNLVLSEAARADTIPNLAIKANDVRCSHGASVGQVSQEDLFYLQSRGISLAEAEHLLVEGFLTDLLTKIKNEATRDHIQSLLIAELEHGARSSETR